MSAVVVRRRADGARELRVNGVFVMDDVETSSERRLADIAIDHGARDVLVGGLGLGFTTSALLADDHVHRVRVAERHPEVVAANEIDDARLEVVVSDVRDLVVAQPAGSVDAVLLDVDNGPDFLVHDDNAGVYGDGFMVECVRVLRPGGLLAVWSMADSSNLRATLSRHAIDVRAEAVPVQLQARSETYWILSGRTAGRAPSSAAADPPRRRR